VQPLVVHGCVNPVSRLGEWYHQGERGDAMATDFSSPDGKKASEESERKAQLNAYLEECATNLTKRAAEGDLPMAFGRDQEIEQILASLASPLKGRIILTGGPRVGKTAIISGIANRIQAGDCPEALKDAQVWALSARSILRAFGVNDWQSKLGDLMAIWQAHPEVILYVDALPTTLAAGATEDDPFDMAQFLLGQLQSSDNRILAEGRTAAVRSFLETYPEYKHVLLDVRINELPVDEARDVVEEVCSNLEVTQETEIGQEAIDVALDLTRRFVHDERLPGKAIDLIGEALALVSESEPRPPLGAQHIIERFSERSGLTRMMLTDDEPYDEAAVRRWFGDQVLGQDQAIDVVVRSLSLLRTRLNNPRRPMGVFLFIGPTGVGKTELARTLSTFLFGSDESLVRFNMADYTLEWHLRVLFGDPHEYELDRRRGQLTMRLQDRTFAVILLDEFEKAHPLIFQSFLQLFDEGILINGASETVNLRNTLIIMTSNFGARLLDSARLGFGPREPLEQQEQRILEETVRFFTPEFINRIDSVLFFKPLTRPVLREIAYRRIQEVLQREGLSRRRLDVEVGENVVDWVVERGYSERYGARYLTRQIEKAITYPLARQIIQHDPPEGSLVRLFVRNDRVASALVLPSTEGPPDLAEAVPVVGSEAEGLPSRLTLSEIVAGVPDVTGRVEALEAAHNIALAREELADLMRAMSTPAFWDHPDEVQPLLDKLSHVSSQVELVDGLRRSLDELNAVLAQMQAGNGAGERRDQLAEAARRYRFLLRELPRAELTLLFTEPHDTLGAYLRVEARGRTAEARKWALQVAEMYLGWAERREFLTTVIGETLAGRATNGVWLGVGGYGAYGLLRGETGTHRYVQAVKGPDGEPRRRVSQVGVVVWPDVPLAELPRLEAGALDVESGRISRAGKLSKRLVSQVAVTHNASGYRLSLNSALPVGDLEAELARLVRIALLMGFADVDASPEGAHPVWGNVVRSYVRYKRNYVEDPRTRLKTGKIQNVLRGDLDAFLQAWLRQQSAPEPEASAESD